MASRSAFLLFFFILSLAAERSLASSVFSSRLIHRFSDEGRASIKPPEPFPEKRSFEYYRFLASIDSRRQRMNLGAKSQSLVPSEGSKTISTGNDFGWLHYTWIDIGTPSVSFLVALDSGSDLLWIPCNCLQCAPLSSTYYTSLATKDLNEYNPSASSTSKGFLCSHKLCESAPSCESPREQCPYTVDYASNNTSSSGLLVEDVLHLAYSANASSSVKARLVVGCGKKQSGDFLDGSAPDGVMGLGPGDISVPSFLSKAGLMRNSFSMCFDEEDSGRIYFGDMGPSTQQSTRFLPYHNEFVAYIVGVEACCIGNSCLKQTNFTTLIDSGQSFTFLPQVVYREVALEIDSHINATAKKVEDGPWEYCYETSVEPKVPAIKLKFSSNNTFVIHKPLFVLQRNQGLVQFCLPIRASEQGIGYGVIGQNYMRGYRIVFDRESMKLGWSPSKCQEDKIAPPQEASPGSTSSPNPLPTEEQQSRSHAVSPAIAGKTPSKTSSSTSLPPCCFSSMRLFNSLLVLLLLLRGVASYM
ncbi:Aspartic proteinase-like protein 1 [Raphanus sativus]|uniref:Aspartic proteinase-like protein 1 isoform X1 n=1 Tax=Raphanus sativus TaxID=3726 RepID=A0A6J0K4C9_RAPSA|nr:aspartic proteinase-like protein 1 isoform X1 [Raphanus sativus]KAJ4883119.1 Aspartic proteinase-like protein 1 [Raphanus sativus]